MATATPAMIIDHLHLGYGERAIVEDLSIDLPRGEVIAIIMRIDDTEDKLIVAPAGERISREEIADAVRFQEQYFDTEILVSPSYTGNDS